MLLICKGLHDSWKTTLLSGKRFALSVNTNTSQTFFSWSNGKQANLLDNYHLEPWAFHDRLITLVSKSLEMLNAVFFCLAVL